MGNVLLDKMRLEAITMAERYQNINELPPEVEKIVITYADDYYFNRVKSEMFPQIEVAPQIPTEQENAAFQKIIDEME